MKLIVGLGNPGRPYEATRHNLGFWVIDAFAHKQDLTFSAKKGEALTSRGHWPHSDGAIDYLLAKPQTFMNRSGRSVRLLLDYYKIPISDFILVYDDVDMDCGRIRIRKKGRAGGHRGVESVITEIGSDTFVRLKIGIGKDALKETSDHVLSNFRADEKQIMEDAVDQSLSLLPLLIEGRIDEAMNRIPNNLG